MRPALTPGVRERQPLLPLILAMLLPLALLPGARATADSSDVPVTVFIGTDWIPLGKKHRPPGNASAVAFRRAVDAAGTPYVKGGHRLGVDLGDLERGFHLEKRTYLLGEPIPVELRIALHGPGTWSEPIGGNYRARGRDDNFLFFLRRADGTWVADPYGTDLYYMGGLSSTYPVKLGEPSSYWLPLQQYVAITEPGRYELYCIKVHSGYDFVGMKEAHLAELPPALAGRSRLDADGYTLVDKRSGKPFGKRIAPTHREFAGAPSPLLSRLPAELRERFAKGVGPSPAITDFARLPLVIEKGTAGERKRMVDAWAEAIDGPDIGSWPSDRVHAAMAAIWFVRQPDFLPLIGEWLSRETEAPGQFYSGLIMNPHPRALELLLSARSDTAIASLHHLPAERIPVAIPRLIERLTDPRDAVRAWSFSVLASWTGKRFGADWSGFDHKRPTPKEGRRMRAEYSAWWAKHKATFRPKSR